MNKVNLLPLSSIERLAITQSTSSLPVKWKWTLFSRAIKTWRRRHQQELQKNNRFRLAKQQLYMCIMLFVYFFAVTAWLQCENPISCTHAVTAMWCTKENVMHVQSLLSCLVKLLLFLCPCCHHSRGILNSLLFYNTLWSVRNRIFSMQIEMFLLIASETFIWLISSSFVSG